MEMIPTERGSSLDVSAYQLYETSENLGTERSMEVSESKYESPGV